jgi:predicted SAM-dependent methyltransferase
MAKKLHLGCGSTTPAGWLNLDGSWGAWLAKYPSIQKLLKTTRLLPSGQLNIDWNPDIFIHDVRKPLPFGNDSFSAIYSSHLLEHLYLEEAKALLKECYRVLEPGGVLRVIVPDLRPLIDEYLNEKFKPSEDYLFRADRLNQKLLLRNQRPFSGNFIYKIYTIMTDFHSHKWVYDADSLSGYVKLAGFENVTAMQANQSRIEGIEQVEDPARILNGAGVCVEGIKPG